MTLTTLVIVGLLAVAPVAAKTGTCPQWERTLEAYLLPVSEFSHIMWAESRCDPRAVHHNTGARDDIGLLQINASWSTVTKQKCRTTKRPEVALLSPTCNLTVAAHLYSTSGLRPWKATAKKEKP